MIKKIFGLRKIATPVAFSCLLLTPCLGQEEELPSQQRDLLLEANDTTVVDNVDAYIDEERGLSSQEDLIDKLFNQPYSRERYNQHISEARKAGMLEQEILEVEIYYHLVNKDDEDLEKILERLEKAEPNWDFSKDSIFFRDARDIASGRYLIKARIAFLQDDAESFEDYSKEAFWLEPENGRLLELWIDEFRFNHEMSTADIPMNLPIQTSEGNMTTFAELMDNNEALIIDFWASWCGPCMALMPHLKEKYEHLESQNILVIGMNTENMRKAERVRQEFDMNMPWLVEPSDRPYTNQLKINSLPRMVVVSNKGEVLFNRHPLEERLKKVLKELGADE